eukprot:5009613-Prymnesium_polylepis.1
MAGQNTEAQGRQLDRWDVVQVEVPFTDALREVGRAHGQRRRLRAQHDCRADRDGADHKRIIPEGVL